MSGSRGFLLNFKTLPAVDAQGVDVEPFHESGFQGGVVLTGDSDSRTALTDDSLQVLIDRQVNAVGEGSGHDRREFDSRHREGNPGAIIYRIARSARRIIKTGVIVRTRRCFVLAAAWLCGALNL